MINFASKLAFVVFLFMLSVNAHSQPASKPVQIIGIGISHGGYVVYRYQIKNNGTQDISRITLGYTNETDNSFAGFTEWPTDPFVALPIIGQWLPTPIISSPDGWGSRLISTADEGGAIGIDWIEGTLAKVLFPRYIQGVNAPHIYSGGKAILSGQVSGEFSVRLERSDYAYVRGYASVRYGDNTLLIPVEKGDTTPPKFTLSLSPSTLQPNEKRVPITANISVKDDYDPVPEIKLESITSNELLEADDIRDARLGTDDRQFMLKAKSEKVGRIYTVVYSATDASGNRTIATATVTVPHDNKEHKNNRESGQD